jgi:hypothetical protein
MLTSILQRTILEKYLLLFLHTDDFLTASENSQRLLDEKPNGVKDLIDKIVYSMKKKKKDHGCVTS